MVCRQLGYSVGEQYTFGASNHLPTLPVVAGFRTCDGTEQNIFGCAACPDCDQCSPDGMDYTRHTRNCAGDMDCRAGCLGPDGRQGTLDDTIDVSW